MANSLTQWMQDYARFFNVVGSLLAFAGVLGPDKLGPWERTLRERLDSLLLLRRHIELMKSGWRLVIGMLAFLTSENSFWAVILISPLFILLSGIILWLSGLFEHFSALLMDMNKILGPAFLIAYPLFFLFGWLQQNSEEGERKGILTWIGKVGFFLTSLVVIGPLLLSILIPFLLASAFILFFALLGTFLMGVTGLAGLVPVFVLRLLLLPYILLDNITIRFRLQSTLVVIGLVFNLIGILFD